MATREQILKRWIIIASTTLAMLIVGIATLIWSESIKENAFKKEQGNLQNSLRSLEILRPGKVDIKLTAIDDHWKIQEPCNIAVNQKRLEPLLSIALPAAFSYDAKEVDLEAAGLINPLATIIANNQRIDIGNTDLSGDRRYIKRDDRVEFVPEWILPLLEGGLSALSELTLFQSPINSLRVDTLIDGQRIISEDPTKWQQLSAQQIVVWPLDENAGASKQATLHPQYAATINSENAEKHLQVFMTTAFAAIVFEDASCAYLLPNDALNTSGQ